MSTRESIQVRWARLKTRRTLRFDPSTKVVLAEIVVRRIDHVGGYHAAALMGDDWPRVNDLRHGKLERLSVQRLWWFLRRLGVTIEIRIVPRRTRPSMDDAPGEIRVVLKRP
jgi:hypothetical protein